jgi:hypothetical protein
MTATHTFTVRGHKVRTSTNRRYVAVAVRPEPVTTEKGTFVAFARVEKRSDNLATLNRAARNNGYATGAFMVVVDTTTGLEVA